jgi:predicted metalloprotease with PDZ domain
VWGRAGLATGDTVLAVNDADLRSPSDFQRAIARLTVGESVTVRYRRGAALRTARIVVGGYDRVRVRLEPLPNPSAEQLRARDRWLHGDAGPADR